MTPRFKEPTTTGGIQGPPYIPGTPPQYDPLGNVTGGVGPGSTLLGPTPTPQPTDMIPPLTGPNSDRMGGNTASTDPGAAWRNNVTMANPAPLPQGQSAANIVGDYLSSIGQAQAATPPAGPAPNVAQAAATAPPDRPVAPPPGILGTINNGIAGAGDWLKKQIPPLSF